MKQEGRAYDIGIAAGAVIMVAFAGAMQMTSTHVVQRSSAAQSKFLASEIVPAIAIESSMIGPTLRDQVAAQIKEMHGVLDITPRQEALWGRVSQIMYENAIAIDRLRVAREQNATTNTALDELASYIEIADARAVGLRKFSPAFESLYASMSDAQKGNADAIFRSHLKK